MGVGVALCPVMILGGVLGNDSGNQILRLYKKNRPRAARQWPPMHVLLNNVCLNFAVTLL